MLKQAEARAKQEHFRCNEMVKKMVIEMAEDTPAASAVGMVMEWKTLSGRKWKEMMN